MNWMDASLAIIVDVPRFILSFFLSLYLSISLCKRKEKKKINFYVYRNKINNFNSILLFSTVHDFIFLFLVLFLYHISRPHIPRCFRCRGSWSMPLLSQILTSACAVAVDVANLDDLIVSVVVDDSCRQCHVVIVVAVAAAAASTVADDNALLEVHSIHSVHGHLLLLVVVVVMIQNQPASSIRRKWCRGRGSRRHANQKKRFVPIHFVRYLVVVVVVVVVSNDHDLRCNQSGSFFVITVSMFLLLFSSLSRPGRK